MAPMLLLRTETLPDDPVRWLYELKMDGYRAVAYKSGGIVHVRSRNGNDFNRRYPGIPRGLAEIPDDTLIDGEVVALDAAGRPSFNALQNAAPPGTTIVYYVFDLMMLGGRDLTGERLEVRRQLLEREVLPKLAEPVRYIGELRAPLRDLIHSVKAQSFEGLVAKRRDSRYEPGLRSGAWMKMRVNQGQEFVIGGYTPGTRNFDALIIGYYEEGRLRFAARTRAGFTPASRQQVFRAFRGLESADCPFANLPEARSGRWGEGLTKAKMADCHWLKPVLVGQFEFLEWTADDHLRHARFVALRDDKPARSVTRG